MEEQERNPFKKLQSDQEVPEEIKEKLLKEISLLRLFGEITDLFSGKMGKTAIELLKRGKKY